MIENTIFSVKSGKIVQNEKLITERTWGEWLGDWAQTGASIASAFIPGSGILVETINALIYFKRADTTSDIDRKGMLYTNGWISIAFALAGPLVQGIGNVLKGILSGTITIAKSGLKIISSALSKFVGLLGRIQQVAIQAAKKLKTSNLAQKTLGNKFLANLEAKLINAKAISERFMSKVVSKASQSAKVSKQPLLTIGGRIPEAAMGGFTKAINFVKSGKTKFTAKQGVDFAKKFGVQPGKIYPISITTGTGKSVGFTGVAKLESFAKQSALFRVVSGPKKGQMVSIPINDLPISIIKTFRLTTLGKGKLGVMLYNMFSSSVDSNTPEPNLDDIKITLAPEEASKLMLDAAGFDAEVADYEGETQNYSVKSGVSAIQQSLESLGISVGQHGVDGKFGPDTQSAIKEFQSKNGLTEDGRMTQKLVTNLAIALVKADKISDAKALVDNEDFSKFNANLKKALQSSNKNEILRNLTGSTNDTASIDSKGVMGKMFSKFG